jgi:ankyrin repeat protein
MSFDGKAASELIAAADGSGHTALMWAAAHQRHQAVQALLEAGADPFVEDTAHHTAFWHSMHGQVGYRFPFINFRFPFIRGAYGTLFMPRVLRTRSARLIGAAMSSRSSGAG